MGKHTSNFTYSDSFSTKSDDRHATPPFGMQPQYDLQRSTTISCLGHPSHPVQTGEVICRSCGALAAGAHLGIYQIQQLLGRGRSGNAYLAQHQRSKQAVVIKLFAPDPVSMGLWEAARREVRTITALRHPSILPNFSCTAWYPKLPPGTTRPLPDLTAPYIEQDVYLLTLCQYAPITLDHFLAHYQKSKRAIQEQGPRFLGYLLSLIAQAGTALSAAHAHGIAHGALVPGNILLNNQGHLWVADFGLARLHTPSAPYLPPELYGVRDACLQKGTMTPFWEAITPAGDQYMLATLCQQILSQLLLPADYEHLQPILQCALHQHPARRFASIDIFIHELTEQAARPSHTTGHSLRPAFEVLPQQDQPSSGEYSRGYVQLTPPPSEAYEKQHPATANYSLASSLPPSTPADDWEKLGGKFFTSRDYESAVNAYLQALELDVNKYSCWLALGDAYFALERYSGALGAYERAAALNSYDPGVWTNLGTALDALGRHKEALICYERADQLNA
ncbi:tetratricopeptide repeat protein [Ktedonosporobacter rubrisoli]|uniref:non-specific serine/threonine protein kinase n=1 Tax=Ktedonosporobacter rubrisoli TaxID=2509675 RepID=A0A4P6K5L2_KTERU|nr:protein kinase family protein [Ktedonosporobacter rubrisoli]QBD83170.1 tetratricopeptide repeat protein [Ktedonosporobacter rubrisoli]